MERKGPIKLTDKVDTVSDVIAASATAVKTAYDTAQYAVNKFNVIDVADLNDLKTKENGWYSISTTISGISGGWVIAKFGKLYTATSTTDPRVVLNCVSDDKNNFGEWYSPYAYWHA